MKYRRVLASLVIAFTALGIYTVWSYVAPHFRPVLTPSQIELVIASDKAVYAIGEHPKITATLTNRTSRAITLVSAIDGSGGRRYPLVTFAVQPPANALPKEVMLGCGNVNALRPSDFHTVRANKPFNVLGEWGGAPWTALNRGPGEYVLQLTYDTNETDVDRWMGGPLALPQDAIATRRTSALLGSVPRFTVSSNTIKFRFENPFTSAEEMLRKGNIEQAKLALRMLEAGEPIGNLPGALTDSLLKNANWDSWEFQEYLSRAMKQLGDSIQEIDLTRFWPILSLDSRTYGQRSFFYSSQNCLNMLRMALRCPGPNREGRLLDLLEHRVTKGRLGGEARGRLIKLDGQCAGALFAESGADIDRVLRKLLEAGGLDNDQFLLVKTEVERRGLSALRNQSGV